MGPVAFGLLIWLLFGAARGALVTKYQTITVAADSWDRNAETLQSKSLHTCAAAAKLYRGYNSYLYNSTSQQCQRANPTCMKPRSQNNLKAVMMTKYTTEYMGCYTDPTATPSLPVFLGVDEVHLTPEDCVFRCAQAGYAFAGVSGGENCFCGAERPIWARVMGRSFCSLACPGNQEKTCGGNGRLQVYHSRELDTPFHELSLADRQSLSLSNSSVRDGKLPELAFDGAMNTVFSSSYEDYRPWLQILMETPQLVKGVRVMALYGSTTPFWATHLEVRVGDSDASANPKNPNDHVLCVNKFCLRTGEVQQSGYADAAVYQDCVTPLTGRYVTVQKVVHESPAHSILQVSEVNVVVYCPGELPPDTCPEPPPDEDCQSVLEITYVGCQEDSLSKHIGAQTPATPLKCIALCAAADGGYTYAGYYPANQCRCTNSIDPAKKRGPYGCPSKCTQNVKETCGWSSPLRYSVWKADDMQNIPTEVWLKTAADKAFWTATASSEKSADHAAAFAVDGAHVNAQTSVFASAEDDAHPWMQIDMGTSLRVKGFKIQGMTACCSYKAIPHLEIRIGDIDVTPLAAPGKRLCVNRVCHTTGTSTKADTSYDCTTTRHGRFVTIQRYRQWHSGTLGTPWGWEMAISEVDILHLV